MSGSITSQDVQHLKLLDDPYLPVARPGAFPDGPVPLAQIHGAPMAAHPPVCDQARVEQELARNAVRPHIVFRLGAPGGCRVSAAGLLRLPLWHTVAGKGRLSHVYALLR